MGRARVCRGAKCGAECEESERPDGGSVSDTRGRVAKWVLSALSSGTERWFPAKEAEYGLCRTTMSGVTV